MKKKLTVWLMLVVSMMASIAVKAQAVEGIVLSTHAMTVNVSEGANVFAHVIPDYAANKKVTAKSLNSKIASIESSYYTDSLGTDFWIRGVSKGSTYIVFTTKDGKYTDSCLVEVKNIAVTGIQVSPNALSLVENATAYLSTTILPYNATDQSVIIENSNPKVASIQTNTLKVKALSLGNTVISFKTVDGNYTAYCNVTVMKKDSTTSDYIAVTGIEVSPNTLSLDADGTAQISVKVLPSNATNQSIVIKNTSPSVASIDPNTNIVKALSKGNTVIKFSTVDGNYSDHCVVKVTGTSSDTTSSEVAVTGIQVSPHSLSLHVGDTAQVTANVLPYNATNQTILINNTNPNVATIDPVSKMVIALAPGYAFLWFTTEDGGYIDTCFVNVVNDTIPPENIPVTGIQVSPHSLSLHVGDTAQVTANVLPYNATNQTILVNNTNPNVATIDPVSKMVIALAPGYAFLWFTTEDGGYTDTCFVNVVNDTIPPENIPVTGIQIASHYFSLSVGDTAYPLPHVLPYNATNQSILVHNYNPDVVVISPETMIITALSPGNALLLFTTVDGGYTDTCHISVSKAPWDTIPGQDSIPSGNIAVTGIRISPNFLSLYVNNTAYISTHVLPYNATNQSIIVENSNPNVATINPSTGIVNALTSGNTRILFRTVDGNYVDSCLVNVINIPSDTIPPHDTITPGNIPVTGIQIASHYFSLSVGDTAYPLPHVLPYNATNQSILVHNYNPDVVVISPETMIITALSPGNALLLFTTVDGGYTDTCHISVSKAPWDTIPGQDTIPSGNIAVTGIQVSPNILTVNVNNTAYISAHVLPYNATNQSIIVENSNPNVATINPSTGIIKALTPGNTRILFRTVDGNYVDSCLVNVVNIPSDTIPPHDTITPGNIPVTGIQIASHYFSLSIGDTAYPSPHVLPYNATNQSIVVHNYNSDIVVISPETMIITALSPGLALITFTTVDGNYTASCYVNVEDPNAKRTELSGIVTRKDNSAVTNGMVLLYAIENSGSYYMMDSTFLKQDGSYLFRNVQDGNYLIKAFAYNLPNAVPTYYGNKENWTDATIVSVLNNSDIKNLNIVIIELDSLKGKASISGYVGKESGSNVLSKSAMANPCQDVNVYLQTQKENAFVTIATTQTNVNGFYEFKNVPVGEYRIILDVAGLEMLNSYTIKVTDEDENIDGNDYAITGEGIDTEHGTGISDVQQKEKVIYHAYPNPTQGLLTIQNIEKSAGFIEIYNLEGKLMQKHKVSFTEETIDMSTLINGIYMLRIGNKSIKVIKQ